MINNIFNKNIFLKIIFAILTVAIILVYVENDTTSKQKTYLFYVSNESYKSPNIVIKSNPPKLVSTVLVPNYDWERSGFGYLTVLDEGDHVKLYYTCHGESRKDLNLCYAKSIDLTNFERVIQNGENNIIDIDITDGGGVFRLGNGEDGYGLLGTLYNSEKARWDQRIYKSSDGVKFDLMNSSLIPFTIDSHNIIFYDEKINKYVAYLRSWNYYPLLIGPDKYYRTVSRVELSNPFEEWGVVQAVSPLYNPYWPKGTPPALSTELEVVLFPDDMDKSNTHIYTPSVNQYAYADKPYIAFPSIYDHFPDPADGGLRTNDGMMNVQLAVSDDGVNFQRFRDPYIDYDLLGDNVKTIYMAHGIVYRDDDIYQYAFASDNLHQDPALNSKILLLHNKKDRFAYVTNDDQEGQIEYKNIDLDKYMFLNYIVEDSGYIQVEVLDNNGKVIDGYSRDESVLLSGDYTGAKVSWVNNNMLPDVRNATLKFYLNKVKLFSFSLTGDIDD
jgi:hypothetical protein